MQLYAAREARSPRSTRRSRRLADDGRALRIAVADLVRLYQFRDRDRICCHDVSVTQCHALEALIVNGPMGLNALARQLFLDKSTASRVVGALERKRYVQRLSDEHDGRAIVLSATGPGRRLHARIQEELDREHEMILADLPRPARRAAIEVIARLARAADERFGHLARARSQTSSRGSREAA